MEIRRTLLNRSSVIHDSDQELDSQQLQSILDVAAKVPGLRQHDVIGMVTELRTCQNVDSVFECIMKEISRFFSFDRSSLAFLDPRDNTVRLRNVRKPNGPLVGENVLIPLDETNVIGWVMLNCSGLRRNDIATRDDFDEQMRTEELRSDMIVPMAAGANVFGTINLGSRRPNAFRAVDLDLLREFGRLVGGIVGQLLADPAPGHVRRHAPPRSE